LKSAVFVPNLFCGFSFQIYFAVFVPNLFCGFSFQIYFAVFVPNLFCGSIFCTLFKRETLYRRFYASCICIALRPFYIISVFPLCAIGEDLIVLAQQEAGAHQALKWADKHFTQKFLRAKTCEIEKNGPELKS